MPPGRAEGLPVCVCVMSLHFGRPPQALTVLPTRRYHPGELEGRVRMILNGRLVVPGPPPTLWLKTEGMMLLLEPQDIPLACRVAAAYHDALVDPGTGYYDDDCFMAETAQMEAAAAAHMEVEGSGASAEDDPPQRGPVCWGGCKG